MRPETLTCLQGFRKLKDLNIVTVMILTTSCLRARQEVEIAQK